MTIPVTPRRSKRGQPVVQSPKKVDRGKKATWSGEPVNTRPTNPEDDLFPVELEQWREEREEMNKDGKEDDQEYETRFYSALEISNPASTWARRTSKGKGTTRGKGKGKGKAADLSDTFSCRIGDTVLVETVNHFETGKQVPHVAVIVDMWETDYEHEETGKMKVLVHWFMRPSEMPTFSAKRHYHQDEIYYSLARVDLIDPLIIIAPCTVRTGRYDNIPESPSKWNLKDDDDEDAPKDDSFQCRLAVDSRKGIFYSFAWDDIRKIAVHAYERRSDEGWGMRQASRDWELDARDYVQDDGKRPSKSKPKAKHKAEPPRKKVKTKHVEEEEAENEEEENEEEDGGAASGEEYELQESESEEEPDEDDEEVDEEELAREDEEDEEDDKLRTPRKRKRVATAFSTPKRPRGRLQVHPTPHSKAAIRRRQKSGSPSKRRAVRPQKTYNAPDKTLKSLPQDAWLRAMHVLHVGSRPEILPCREGEYDKVLQSVRDMVEEGSGGCLYISGLPGTGKTATVYSVIRELQRMAKDNETNPFTYCEINGLKIPDPSTAYTMLWEAVSGHDVAKEGHLKITTKESLRSLTKYFGGGAGRGRGPGDYSCVVLMDELDQLVTTKQDVIYNFFNWPTISNSKLIVIAVANTHDLPERVMTGRVRSRLGMTRINFQPYSWQQLRDIVQARLTTAFDSLENKNAKEVLNRDGIKLAAMKVSGITGDCRRVLDMCRRAVELAREQKRTAGSEDIQAVIKLMQTSPTAAYLRDCSLHERIMLASLIKCVKREGVEEIKLGDVQYQHLIYVDSLTPDSDPRRRPTKGELDMILQSLVCSRAMLLEDGVAAMRKAEGERKVILNLEQSEVERVLSEVGGDVWKKILNA